MNARLFRDAYGVPHVRAESLLELAEAQGRVTARDRGDQIQVEHWRAQGTLAEHIGRDGVAWDRFARSARIADTARRASEALDPDDRAWVSAYVDGVNAVLPEARWPEWAPLGILHVTHLLFSDLPSLLWREHVRRALGDAFVDVFHADTATGSGSNAWALHGSRTSTGAPLLAGDPHRTIGIPAVYQQIRLACPGVDVVGLAFPGVPGVPHFGHAEKVAWGITNAAAHHVDVFRERLRRTESGEVQAYGPAGWEAVASGEEVIAVRDDDPVAAGWIETPRGLVVAGPGLGPGFGPERPGYEVFAYSARFPARATSDLGTAALRPLLQARSAEEVAAAFGRWVDPVNRVLTADQDGKVLSLTAGRVPETGATARRRSRDGWEAGVEKVAWRRLPPSRPIHDCAVDANERPEDPALRLGHAYSPPHRARRIRTLLDELLDGRGALDVEDMHDIHRDTLSSSAVGLLHHLPAPGDTAVSARAHELAARLRGWDGRMDAASVEAAAFAAWRSALVGRLADLPALAALHAPHEMGPVLDPWFDVRARIADGLGVLLAADGPAGPLGIDRAAVARDALEDAAARDGGEAWGDRHRLEPQRVLAGVPGAAFARLPRTGLSGDTDTVRSTATIPGVSDVCSRGSVARWIWDLSDRSRSRWGVPFGAAGDPASPHSLDQHEHWLDARTVPIATGWDALTEEHLP